MSCEGAHIFYLCATVLGISHAAGNRTGEKGSTLNEGSSIKRSYTEPQDTLGSHMPLASGQAKREA